MPSARAPRAATLPSRRPKFHGSARCTVGGQRPGQQSLIALASRDKPQLTFLLSRDELDRSHRTVMAQVGGEAFEELAVVHLPQADGLIVAAGGTPTAIPTEGHAVDRFPMAFMFVAQLQGRSRDIPAEVPDSADAVGSPGEAEVGLRGTGDTADGDLVGQNKPWLVGAAIPDADSAIVAGGENFPGGTDGHAGDVLQVALAHQVRADRLGKLDGHPVADLEVLAMLIFHPGLDTQPAGILHGHEGVEVMDSIAAVLGDVPDLAIDFTADSMEIPEGLRLGELRGSHLHILGLMDLIQSVMDPLQEGQCHFFLRCGFPRIHPFLRLIPLPGFFPCRLRSCTISFGSGDLVHLDSEFIYDLSRLDQGQQLPVRAPRRPRVTAETSLSGRRRQPC